MQHIPTYPIIIFVVLIYLGIKRCYPRTLHPARMFLFPVIMILFGTRSISHLFPQAGWQEVMTILIGFVFGNALGWLHAVRWRLVFDANKVRIPGDPSLFLILLATFALEFALHYGKLSHRPWAQTTFFQMTALVMWGLLTGMAMGRALYILFRSYQSRHSAHFL